MNANSGWIKLYRKMTEWEWYTDIPVKVLYIHLLLNANHENGRWKGEEIKRGELITSLSHLSSETGLSVREVRTALKKLEATGEISLEATKRFTLVKCLNYGVYQSRELDNRQSESKETADGGQTNDSKQEYKNKKKNKNERLKRRAGFDIYEIARRAKLNDDYDI